MRAQALLSFAIMASTATAIANETATIIFTEMDSVDLVGKVIGTVQEPSLIHATRQSSN